MQPNDMAADWRSEERRIKIHGPEDYAGMRRAGKLAAETLDFVIEHVVPGVPVRYGIW